MWAYLASILQVSVDAGEIERALAPCLHSLESVHEPAKGAFYIHREQELISGVKTTLLYGLPCRANTQYPNIERFLSMPTNFSLALRMTLAQTVIPLDSVFIDFEFILGKDAAGKVVYYPFSVMIVTRNQVSTYPLATMVPRDIFDAWAHNEKYGQRHLFTLNSGCAFVDGYSLEDVLTVLAPLMECPLLFKDATAELRILKQFGLTPSEYADVGLGSTIYNACPWSLTRLSDSNMWTGNHEQQEIMFFQNLLSPHYSNAYYSSMSGFCWIEALSSAFGFLMPMFRLGFPNEPDIFSWTTPNQGSAAFLRLFAPVGLSRFNLFQYSESHAFGHVVSMQLYSEWINDGAQGDDYPHCLPLGSYTNAVCDRLPYKAALRITKERASEDIIVDGRSGVDCAIMAFIAYADFKFLPAMSIWYEAFLSHQAIDADNFVATFMTCLTCDPLKKYWAKYTARPSTEILQEAVDRWMTFLKKDKGMPCPVLEAICIAAGIPLCYNSVPVKITDFTLIAGFASNSQHIMTKVCHEYLANLGDVRRVRHLNIIMVGKSLHVTLVLPKPYLDIHQGPSPNWWLRPAPNVSASSLQDSEYALATIPGIIYTSQDSILYNYQNFIGMCALMSWVHLVQGCPHSDKLFILFCDIQGYEVGTFSPVHKVINKQPSCHSPAYLFITNHGENPKVPSMTEITANHVFFSKVDQSWLATVKDSLAPKRVDKSDAVPFVLVQSNFPSIISSPSVSIVPLPAVNMVKCIDGPSKAAAMKLGFNPDSLTPDQHQQCLRAAYPLAHPAPANQQAAILAPLNALPHFQAGVNPNPGLNPAALAALPVVAWKRPKFLAGSSCGSLSADENNFLPPPHHSSSSSSSSFAGSFHSAQMPAAPLPLVPLDGQALFRQFLKTPLLFFTKEQLAVIYRAYATYPYDNTCLTVAQQISAYTDGYNIVSNTHHRTCYFNGILSLTSGFVQTPQALAVLKTAMGECDFGMRRQIGGHYYGHPLLRELVDYFSVKIYAEINHLAFVETAAKWHKTIELHPGAVCKIFRPQLMTYDHEYYAKHPVDQTHYTVENALLTNLDQIDADIWVNIDTAYYVYPLICSAAKAGKTVYVVVMTVPNKAGTYETYANNSGEIEAKAEVYWENDAKNASKSLKLKMMPNDNPTHYISDHVIPYTKGQSFTHHGAFFSAVKTAQVGEQFFITYYKVTAATEADSVYLVSSEKLSLHNPFVTYPILSQDDETLIRARRNIMTNASKNLTPKALESILVSAYRQDKIECTAKLMDKIVVASRQALELNASLDANVTLERKMLEAYPILADHHAILSPYLVKASSHLFTQKNKFDLKFSRAQALYEVLGCMDSTWELETMYTSQRFILILLFTCLLHPVFLFAATFSAISAILFDRVNSFYYILIALVQLGFSLILPLYDFEFFLHLEVILMAFIFIGSTLRYLPKVTATSFFKMSILFITGTQSVHFALQKGNHFAAAVDIHRWLERVDEQLELKIAQFSSGKHMGWYATYGVKGLKEFDLFFSYFLMMIFASLLFVLRDPWGFFLKLESYSSLWNQAGSLALLIGFVLWLTLVFRPQQLYQYIPVACFIALTFIPMNISHLIAAETTPTLFVKLLKLLRTIQQARTISSIIMVLFIDFSRQTSKAMKLVNVTFIFWLLATSADFIRVIILNASSISFYAPIIIVLLFSKSQKSVLRVLLSCICLIHYSAEAIIDNLMNNQDIEIPEEYKIYVLALIALVKFIEIYFEPIAVLAAVYLIYSHTPKIENLKTKKASKKAAVRGIPRRLLLKALSKHAYYHWNCKLQHLPLAVRVPLIKFLVSVYGVPERTLACRGEGLPPVAEELLNRQKFHPKSTVTEKQFFGMMPPNSRGKLRIDNQPVTSMDQIYNWAFDPLKRAKCHRARNIGITYPEADPIIMDSNTVNTAFAIVGRHTASRLLPDPQVAERFVAFAQSEIDNWFTAAEPLFEADFQDFDAYIKHVPEPKKKIIYQKAYDAFFLNQNFDGRYVCSVKTEEVLYKPLGSARPRNLFDPPALYKAIFGFLNYNILRSLKQVVPGFIQGYSPDDFCEEFKRLRSAYTDPHIFNYDGSSHDSNQDAKFIEGVDGYLLNKFWQPFSRLSGLSETLLDIMQSQIAATAPWFVRKASIGDLPMSGTFIGTTFTGHPTATTLGNTIRVYLYAKFIMSQAGVVGTPVVSGDDCMCLIEHTDTEPFEAAFWRFYYPKEATEFVYYGLGQVAKEASYTYDTFSYLSKAGIIYPDGNVYFHRKYTRARIGGNFSTALSRQKAMTQAEHATSVTEGLESWQQKHPFIQDLCAYRRKVLPHVRDPKIQAYLDLDYAYLNHVEKKEDSHQDFWATYRLAKWQGPASFNINDIASYNDNDIYADVNYPVCGLPINPEIENSFLSLATTNPSVPISGLIQTCPLACPIFLMLTIWFMVASFLLRH